MYKFTRNGRTYIIVPEEVVKLTSGIERKDENDEKAKEIDNSDEMWLFTMLLFAFSTNDVDHQYIKEAMSRRIADYLQRLFINSGAAVPEEVWQNEH